MQEAEAQAWSPEIGTNRAFWSYRGGVEKTKRKLVSETVAAGGGMTQDGIGWRMSDLCLLRLVCEGNNLGADEAHWPRQRSKSHTRTSHDTETQAAETSCTGIQQGRT